MFDKSKGLVRLYCGFLKAQFEKTKPDFQIISGVIKGLTSVIVKFSGEFVSDANNVQTVFKYVMLGALNPPSGLKQYHIPKGNENDMLIYF